MSFVTVATHSVGDILTAGTDWNTYIAGNLNWLNSQITGAGGALTCTSLTSSGGITINDANTGVSNGPGVTINRSSHSYTNFFSSDSNVYFLNSATNGTFNMQAGASASAGTIFFTLAKYGVGSALFTVDTSGNGVCLGTLTAAGASITGAATFNNNVTFNTGTPTFNNGLTVNSANGIFLTGSQPLLLGSGSNGIYNTNAGGIGATVQSSGDLLLAPGAGHRVFLNAGLGGNAVYNPGKTSTVSCANASSTTIAHSLGAIPNSVGGLWATTNVVGNRACAIGFVTPTTAEVKITNWDATNITIYNNSGATAYVTAWAML